MRNETKSKCLPKFYVSSKQDTLPWATEPPCQQFVHAKETIETFNGSTWNEKKKQQLFFSIPVNSGFRNIYLNFKE